MVSTRGRRVRRKPGSHDVSVQCRSPSLKAPVLIHRLNGAFSCSLARSLSFQAIKYQQFVVSPHVIGDEDLDTNIYVVTLPPLFTA